MHAQLRGANDRLVTVRPILDPVERFAELIETDPDDPSSLPFGPPRELAGLRARRTSSRTLSGASAATSRGERLGANPPRSLMTSSLCCDGDMGVRCYWRRIHGRLNSRPFV